MTRFRLVLSSILVFALIAVVAADAGRRTAAVMADGIPARSFEFTYHFYVPPRPAPARPTHLWIRFPPADCYPDIRGVHIASPGRYPPGRNPEYPHPFLPSAPKIQQSVA